MNSQITYTHTFYFTHLLFMKIYTRRKRNVHMNYSFSANKLENLLSIWIPFKNIPIEPISSIPRTVKVETNVNSLNRHTILLFSVFEFTWFNSLAMTTMTMAMMVMLKCKDLCHYIFNTINLKYFTCSFNTHTHTPLTTFMQFTYSTLISFLTFYRNTCTHFQCCI